VVSGAQCRERGRERERGKEKKRARMRTGRVGKLVLLAFYPVLQGLGIAPCDLDFLLDGFLVHVGHATPLGAAGWRVSRVEVVRRRARERAKAATAGKSRGPRRERSSPELDDGREGSRRAEAEAAMAAGARGAAAIACAGNGMGRRARVQLVWWRGLAGCGCRRN
jgi:hypothetical protein